VCHDDVVINPLSLAKREIAYVGDWYYDTEDYPSMLELMSQGLPLAELCTHEVDADGAQSAITEFINGQTGKVVIRWS
jgi:VCBS repeat-containing protein